MIHINDGDHKRVSVGLQKLICLPPALAMNLLLSQAEVSKTIKVTVLVALNQRADLATLTYF